MSDTARIGHRLWPATFVLRARDAILRPDFHGHADDVVALFAQQIAGDAGVHSTAHAKENALSFSIHVKNRNSSRGRSVNVQPVVESFRELIPTSKLQRDSVIKYPNRRAAVLTSRGWSFAEPGRRPPWDHTFCRPAHKWAAAQSKPPVQMRRTGNPDPSIRHDVESPESRDTKQWRGSRTDPFRDLDRVIPRA